MNIVICGLSLTSSWGNGHATTYRALTKALAARGHDVLFLECDRPWYAERRDLTETPACRIELYDTVQELRERFGSAIADADAVIVGSYVQDGIEVGDFVLNTARGVRAFYDIDTPVTLANLGTPANFYVSREQIGAYDLYLSFTGGAILDRLEREFGCRRARALYCAVDARAYTPDERTPGLDLGYLGTYSADRQPTLERLMFEPARAWDQGRFRVVGAQFPTITAWPTNVGYESHRPPAEHRAFYTDQRFTLNVTRADMIQAGFSPSVRLFEAAACGTPIITDRWTGLGDFFTPGSEILVADTAAEVLGYLRDLPEVERRAIGARARARVLAEHTADHRALALEGFITEAARDAVRAKVDQLAPWFHNVELPEGIQTAPDHFLGPDFPARKWREIADAIPQDLRGWTVLDIGCNAGFYSFECARRGARVLGIDVDPHYLAQARWLAGRYHRENPPEFAQMQIHDLARLNREFDLVLFMGVFYHLRYPQLALDTVAAKARRLMIFQTLTMDGDAVQTPELDYDIDQRDVFAREGWPKMAFIERNFSNDPTNWWAPNHAAVEAMLRSTGFASVERIAHEIYACRAPGEGIRAARGWDADEWTSAVGLNPPPLTMNEGG